jgi:hypothetical protein
VIGILPHEEAVLRPVGAILLEQNNGWSIQRGPYMTRETITTLNDKPIVGLPTVAV